MPKITVRDGFQRAARLIPFNAGNLRGDYAAVCSPASTVPEQFREAQQHRTKVYFRTGARNLPGDAPRYYVTSYGVPIAWVTLDGRTHASHIGEWGDISDAQQRTMMRHQEAVFASWPDRFEMDSQGDPVFVRTVV